MRHQYDIGKAHFIKHLRMFLSRRRKIIFKNNTTYTCIEKEYAQLWALSRNKTDLKDTDKDMPITC